MPTDALRKKHWYVFALLILAGFAFFIRVWNLSIYNPYWGDDGGAHLAYIHILATEHRLPTMEETYLAWHEPGYYLFMIVPYLLGGIVGIKIVQLLLFGLFFYLVYRLGTLYTTNKQVIFGLLFVVSVLFSGVKISSFPTNELFAQLWILLLVYVAISVVLPIYTYIPAQHTSTKAARLGCQKHPKLRLLSLPVCCSGIVRHNYAKAVCFGLLVGIGLWIKLSVILVLFALALVVLYTSIYQKTLRPWYVFACIAVTAALVYSPWLVYKQATFGNALSINSYEQENRQPLFTKASAQLFTNINIQPLISQPYWEHRPHSFWTVLAFDMVNDYYHLFDHVDYEQSVSLLPKVITGNGRSVSLVGVSNSLWVNRTGMLVLLVLAIGVIGAAIHAVMSMRKKQVSDATIFFLILIVGGFAALVYNALRFPFLERGIVKFHFIYFTLPLMALVGYDWWQRNCPWRLLSSSLIFGPLVLYTICAWQIIVIQLF